MSVFGLQHGWTAHPASHVRVPCALCCAVDVCDLAATMWAGDLDACSVLATARQSVPSSYVLTDALCPVKVAYDEVSRHVCTSVKASFFGVSAKHNGISRLSLLLMFAGTSKTSRNAAALYAPRTT